MTVCDKFLELPDWGAGQIFSLEIKFRFIKVKFLLKFCEDVYSDDSLLINSLLSSIESGHLASNKQFPIS